MKDLWYKNAIIYGLDLSRFQDSDGNGIGDFQGLIRRLDYLADLGITCIWLLPCYPSPDRDNGYDIEDYLAINPQHGTLDDFIEFIHCAGERGIRVIMDLVMNHTSDQHPWFQAGRRDSASRFRDYYVWTDSPPPIPPGEGTIFPGQEDSVWTYDEVAGSYYYHRFYHFEPELKIANPQVLEEIFRTMDYWLSFGVSGFRVDAASHMIEKKGIDSARPENPHGILRDLRKFVEERREGAILLGESDVRAAELEDYFGEGDELNLLFNFLLDNYLFLALAREETAPIEHVLGLLPAIPHEGQWANFLRNLDEADLERLTPEERDEVFSAFAPDENMRIYGRGIRRRLAPMFDGDQRRLKLAFSLLFALPGSPMIVYGDEIGMGEDLARKGRNAVRTTMQWSDEPNGGFSDVPAGSLGDAVISAGDFAYDELNVARQQADPDSLLNWMKRLIHTRRQCPELGWGPTKLVRTGNPAVLAHRAEWRGGHVLTVHNLSGKACSATLDLTHQQHGELHSLLGEAPFEMDSAGNLRIDLEAYDYKWLREGSTGSEHPAA
ncbi:MAG TPA: alpha-amylase family protein [Longimicrobiaceae bacterium]|nr:alpha-amylase family protein [Longimicrobiaceae bacterium]